MSCFQRSPNSVPNPHLTSSAQLKALSSRFLLSLTPATPQSARKPNLNIYTSTVLFFCYSHCYTLINNHINILLSTSVTTSYPLSFHRPYFLFLLLLEKPTSFSFVIFTFSLLLPNTWGVGNIVSCLTEQKLFKISITYV